MGLKEEIMFLVNLKKKLELTNATPVNLNRAFNEIIKMNELVACFSKDALEIFYEMNGMTKPETKEVKKVESDPCSRAFSGVKIGGC